MAAPGQSAGRQGVPVVNVRNHDYLEDMENRLLIGSHMSISGGMHTAFERGGRIGCATMQVFTKNSNQWSGRAYSAEDIEKYKVAAAKSTIAPVVAHASYLINLSATNPATLKRSRAAFIDELQRCAALGIHGLIFHPGAHLGSGDADGIKRIAESLNIAHDATPGIAPLSILETTAGQGTALGWRFEQLRAIIDAVGTPLRMAVCLDTCHVFAAGYDITAEEGWDSTMQEFDRVVGLSRLAAIHVNDSKRELGSRIDRHDHIGKGRIGLTAFRMLMTDQRLVRVPKILETEKSEDLHEDVENLALLRSLAG